MQYPERLIQARAKAASYVASRQCENGGFCVYRSVYLEQANLADTWHALASLQLLQQPIPNTDRLRQWLDGFVPATLNAEELYYWSCVHRQLQLDWVPDVATRQQIALLPLTVPELDAGETSVLAHWLRTLRLKQAFCEFDADPALIAWLRRLHRGGYGVKPNLQATALAIELLAALNQPDTSQETREFINALQRRPYGFDNTLDSSYCRLDILHSGVRCCQYLGMQVKFADEILATVVAAQRGDGAFADVPGALPTLESHYTALALMQALACLAK